MVLRSYGAAAVIPISGILLFREGRNSQMLSISKFALLLFSITEATEIAEFLFSGLAGFVYPVAPADLSAVSVADGTGATLSENYLCSSEFAYKMTDCSGSNNIDRHGHQDRKECVRHLD